NRMIRSWAPLISPSTRRWISGVDGDIYHYELFDPATNRFGHLWIYHVDEPSWRLQNLTYADEAAFPPEQASVASSTRTWSARNGWIRGYTVTRKDGRNDLQVKYDAFTTRALMLPPPVYFKTDVPDPEQMTYGELRAYIVKLRESGA